MQSKSIGWFLYGKRETETETERQRQRDRERETERQSGRTTDRQTEGLGKELQSETWGRGGLKVPFVSDFLFEWFDN